MSDSTPEAKLYYEAAARQEKLIDLFVSTLLRMGARETVVARPDPWVAVWSGARQELYISGVDIDLDGNALQIPPGPWRQVIRSWPRAGLAVLKSIPYLLGQVELETTKMTEDIKTLNEEALVAIRNQELRNAAGSEDNTRAENPPAGDSEGALRAHSTKSDPGGSSDIG